MIRIDPELNLSNYSVVESDIKQKNMFTDGEEIIVVHNYKSPKSNISSIIVEVNKEGYTCIMKEEKLYMM